MNLDKINIEIENKKRISKSFNIPCDDVIDLVKTCIRNSNEIKREDKNIVINCNEIKVIVNAASFKIVTVKKVL